MTRPSDSQIVMLCGRTLQDYRESGSPLVPGFHVVTCKHCGLPICLSPEAGALLDHPRALPLCLPCMDRHMGQPEFRGKMELKLTEVAKQAVETNPIARLNYDRLKEKL